jgi:hypothetical protein
MNQMEFKKLLKELPDYDSTTCNCKVCKKGFITEIDFKNFKRFICSSAYCEYKEDVTRGFMK